MVKNITKNNRVFWHGTEDTKEESLFKQRILCRYDRIARKYLVIYKLAMNDYLVAKISDEALEDVVLNQNFRIRTFEALIKMPVLDWANLPFPVKLNYLLQYIPSIKMIDMEIVTEHATAKDVCSMTKIKYDNSFKFM